MENNELIERLGCLIDVAENYLSWKNNPFTSLEIKMNGYILGLEKLRDEIKTIYLELGGEDWWEEDV